MSEHGISGPHNPFPGEATPHVDSQSTSRAFTSPPPAPTVAPTPSEPRSGMLESVLTLLVEEMRELKKSNMALHNEVRQLREKQQETDDKIERLNQNASRTTLPGRGQGIRSSDPPKTLSLLQANGLWTFPTILLSLLLQRIESCSE